MDRRQLCIVLLLTSAVHHAATAQQQTSRPTNPPIYFNDFNNLNNGHQIPNWSHSKRIKAPKQDNMLLGPFANEQVIFTLTQLPKHEYVKISFDLIVAKTWDGTQEWTTDKRIRIGPDIWGVKLINGPVLTEGALTNDITNGLKLQSFPALLPFERLRPRSTAIANNNLGFNAYGNIKDATYRLQFTFRHNQPILALMFYAKNLQEITDECWMLDQVKVQPMTTEQLTPLSKATFTKLARQLADPDPAAAFNAGHQLLPYGPDAAEQLLALTRDKSSDQQPTPNIQKLVEQLDADQYQIRQQATEQLKTMVIQPKIAKRLQNHLENTDSAEVRWRLKTVLEEHTIQHTTTQLTPEQLQTQRIHALVRLIQQIEQTQRNKTKPDPIPDN